MMGPEIMRGMAPGGASSMSAGVKTATPPDPAGRQQVVDSGKQLPQRDQGTAAPIEQAAAVVQEYMEKNAHSLRFMVDAQSGVNMFAVVDRATGDVVKQVPSEEVLATARYIADQIGNAAPGVLLDTQG